MFGSKYEERILSGTVFVLITQDSKLTHHTLSNSLDAPISEYKLRNFDETSRALQHTARKAYSPILHTVSADP